MTLLEIQRRMAGAIMAPLGKSDHIALIAPGGRAMSAEAADIVKPNDRLTSVERLEIYARSYWFRILDSLSDDFPGLRAILGPRAFDRLARVYLAELPSESFDIGKLGSRLASWLSQHLDYAGKHPTLALDMVRLEWAHMVAFDGASEPTLGPEDLLDLHPGLYFRLQPYITLLELSYPVDDLHIQVSDLPEGHAGASNAFLRGKERSAVKRYSLKPERVFLAVHRQDYSVYFRRLEPAEFRLLQALAEGQPIGEALELLFADDSVSVDDLRGKLEGWFDAWSRMGWFCKLGEAS